MSLLVIAHWRDADGALCGRSWPNRSQQDAQGAVQEGFRHARQMRGTDRRVTVTDDLTWRLVARVREKAV